MSFSHQVGRAVHRPAVVDEDVLQSAAGGEVDIVFVGPGVDARLEVHAVEVQRVPPVPGHLPRTDPRRVGDLRRGPQAVDHVAEEQSGVVLRDDGYAPREGARAVGPGDELLAVDDDLLLVVVAARILDRPGIGRQHAPQLRLAGRGVQEEAGVVVEVGFREEHSAPFGQLDQHGQEHQPPRIEPRHRLPDVGVLERVGELPFEILELEAVNVGCAGRVIFGEGEVRLLAFDDDRSLLLGDEPVGHAVVVEAEHEAVIAAERDRQFVVAVADARLGVERGFDRLVRRVLPDADDPGIVSQRFASGERHGHGRRGQHGSSVGLQRDAEVGSDRDGTLQFAVGRGERVAFRGRGRRRGARETEQKEQRFESHRCAGGLKAV